MFSSKNKYFHIFYQLQKQNMIFNTKSERPLFVDKIPCKTFFFCSIQLINGSYTKLVHVQTIFLAIKNNSKLSSLVKAISPTVLEVLNGDLFGPLQRAYDQKKRCKSSYYVKRKMDDNILWDLHYQCGEST